MEGQDAAGFGMNELNGGNNNGVFQFSYDLTFQYSPFYIVEHEIIKPTVLTMDGNPIRFRLSSNQMSCFNYSNRFESRESKLKFQIRIGKIPDDGLSSITDYLPPGLQISYGSSVRPHHLHHSFPQEPRQAIDCTSLLIHQNVLKDLIYTQWFPDKNNYALTLNLVRQLTVTTLIKQLRVKGDENSRRNMEKTKNFIINMMADDDVVLATGKSANCFALLCPLSKQRMEIPVRSKNCQHLQCFDALSFLLMNEKRPTWECPVCDIYCPFHELDIKYYFLEILTSSALSGDCRYIEFKSDGTWIACEKNEMEKEPMISNEDECIINDLE